MSTNRLCNNYKSPQNSQGRQALSDQINYEHVLGWFKKLELGVQNDLMRELSSKVEGSSTSIDKLTCESEEDSRLRKFKELFKKYPCNSQKAFGIKVLKAYVRAHGLSHLSSKKQVYCSSSSGGSSVDDHQECNSLNKHHELFNVKSLDHLKRGGSQDGVCVDREESSLKLELFKVKSLGHLERGGSQNRGVQDQCLKQLSVVHEESSLKLELFKIKTLVLKGSAGTHGGQGSSDERVQQ